MKKNILHISDLHIDNFLGDDEYLRKGFYKEYINEFINSLGVNAQNIDFVIITGDIVNIGKIENFEAALEIVTYLAKKLNIPLDKIGFSIGNHDYKYKEDDGTNSAVLRLPFHEFSKKFIHKTVLVEGYRFSLHKIDDNFFLLSIDPTLDKGLAAGYADLKDKIITDKKNEIRDKPGKLETLESDDIIAALRENITDQSLLLIGCHYPIEKFPGSALYEEEEEFDTKHVWNYAAGLRTRINRIPSLATCWFFGDTHAPDAFSDGNIFYIMNGRFGTLISKSSQIPRQAKILKYNSEGESSLVTIATVASTHKDNPSIVNWNLVESRIRNISTPVLKAAEKEIIIETSADRKIELLSQEIENQIIGKITEQDLYSFGRFRTSKSNTSLGWISINPLLNTGKILASIIGKSQKHIEEKLSIKPESSIILGLEFWGAIIGSQVSISTGISCYCLATKGNGRYHTPPEIDHDIIKKKLPATTDIVFFIDVVSCGETVQRVISAIDKIKTELAITVTINYHVISVIANGNEYNESCASSFTTFGTFCKSLKIPIIKDELLPDSSLIPYDVDLTTD